MFLINLYFHFIEVQTLRESGERVPEVISEERWTQLINLPLLESRKTLYGYDDIKIIED
jgi:hypothetical protein